MNCKQALLLDINQSTWKMFKNTLSVNDQSRFSLFRKFQVTTSYNNDNDTSRYVTLVSVRVIWLWYQLHLSTANGRRQSTWLTSRLLLQYRFSFQFWVFDTIFTKYHDFNININIKYVGKMHTFADLILTVKFVLIWCDRWKASKGPYVKLTDQ